MIKVTSEGWPEPTEWAKRLHDRLEQLGADYMATPWAVADDPDEFSGLNFKQARAAEIVLAVAKSLDELPLFKKSKGRAAERLDCLRLFGPERAAATESTEIISRSLSFGLSASWWKPMAGLRRRRASWSLKSLRKRARPGGRAIDLASQRCRTGAKRLTLCRQTLKMPAFIGKWSGTWKN
jgi:hypothetical protein